VAEKGVPPLGVLKKIFRKYDHVMEPACLYPVTQEKFQSWVALMADAVDTTRIGRLEPLSREAIVGGVRPHQLIWN